MMRIGIISGRRTVRTGARRAHHVPPHRMVVGRKVIRSGPARLLGVGGEAKGHHLLLVYGHQTLLGICLELSGGWGIVGRIIGILTMIGLRRAMGIALPVFVGVHTFWPVGGK